MKINTLAAVLCAAASVTSCDPDNTEFFQPEIVELPELDETLLAQALEIYAKPIEEWADALSEIDDSNARNSILNELSNLLDGEIHMVSAVLNVLEKREELIEVMDDLGVASGDEARAVLAPEVMLDKRVSGINSASVRALVESVVNDGSVDFEGVRESLFQLRLGFFELKSKYASPLDFLASDDPLPTRGGGFVYNPS